MANMQIACEGLLVRLTRGVVLCMHLQQEMIQQMPNRTSNRKERNDLACGVKIGNTFIFGSKFVSLVIQIIQPRMVYKIPSPNSKYSTKFLIHCNCSQRIA